MQEEDSVAAKNAELKDYFASRLFWISLPLLQDGGAASKQEFHLIGMKLAAAFAPNDKEALQGFEAWRIEEEDRSAKQSGGIVIGIAGAVEPLPAPRSSPAAVEPHTPHGRHHATL